MRSGQNNTTKPSSSLSPAEYREMHIKLGFLAIAVIINVAGFSILFPLSAYLIKNALGYHIIKTDPRIAAYSAWLTAVYAVMQFIFAPLWGKLSDKIGRKRILVGSLIGDIVFYTMMGFSHTIAGLFVARILAGIFSSASLSVSQAYAADVTPPEHRATGLGMIGASFGIGFILGPVIGGVFSQFGLSVPLFIAAFLAFINLLYIVFKLPEPVKHTVQEIPQPASVLVNRLRSMAESISGPMGYLYFLTFCVTFAFANLEGTFSPYLMQVHGLEKYGSSAIQGGIFAYLGIIIVLVQGGAIRPLVKRYGEANLVFSGLLLMAIGFLFFPYARSLTALMLGPMLPIAIGCGLNTPALRAVISRKTSANTQGATLGISASFDSLARATGPWAAGWLYAHYTPQTPYLIAAVIMMLSLLLAAANRKDLYDAGSSHQLSTVPASV